MKTTKQTEIDKVKFWNMFKGLSINECWEFKGARTSAGYGQVWKYPKVIYSHRVAWELIYGEIPKGMSICHHCDNPPCCNPKHLFLGTHADNMHDAKTKGRNKYTTLYGENHPLSKLTEEDVITIRKIYQKGVPGKASPFSTKGIAKRYGVAYSLISRIILGKSWPHCVPGSETKDILLEV